MIKKYLLPVITFLLVSGASLAQDEARLLRFPATNGTVVVFSYAGDLYEAGINGGVARKLTNDIGYEMFPRFSPDGKTLAFTGQYDGNTEIYAMSANGGVPKRLTFTATLGRDDVSDRMGPNNITMGWRDNTTIIYRSRQLEFNDFKGQLFTVAAQGGMSEQLPLPRGGFCSYSPDGSKLAYNRVFREFRTWKRYRGGQADDVWIYNFKTKKTENITNNPAQDIIPMWHGNMVFFISDRNSRLNLYSYNLDTKETKQLTTYKDYDIKFPSLGGDFVVYENGGYIYKYDIKKGVSEQIKIQMQEDRDAGRSKLVDVSKSVRSYEISPDGKRALFSARGDIFTVPKKNGATRNLTATSGAHERNPKWSPNGKFIAYVSDVSGEDEIYIVAQDGSGKPTRLTKDGNCYKYNLYWSPDSKKIVWSDRSQHLYYLDVESTKITEVDYCAEWEFDSYAWSPDSKWITYSKQMPSNTSQVFVYSLDTKKSTVVTDEWYTSGSSEFSDDGKYLFFVSNRNFAPNYGWAEWNHIYQDMAKIYFIPLAKNGKSPFEPKSDEVTIKDTTVKKDETKDNKDSKTVNVDIDFTNIFNRVIELPVSGSQYWGLGIAGNSVYYQRKGSEDGKSKLFLYDLEAKKETELGDIDGYEISADRKKMLVSQMQSYAIIDLPSAKIDLKEKLQLNDMQVTVNYTEEWKQIFFESWRQMRDFLYAPNMHGVDWEKIRNNYAELLPYVNHRADLTYIIGEMISELNIGHAYVGGGEYPKQERIKLGLLGARIVKADGAFKIVKILNGANWEKSLRSPLTEIGVNVKEGDYILAVNGKPASELTDIYEALLNTAGKQVTLKVNNSSDEKGARNVTVVPVEDEHSLYYYNWIQGNIKKVSDASNGEIGYIHIPDMGPAGLNQFSKMYYPQLKKKALVIDVRGNGGGNVSSMILERLKRELTMMTIARNTTVDTDPPGMHVGPKIALIDEFSASDGDIFSYRFKANKLGKTVGKRTWGGVVGIRGSLPFVDGGTLNRPEFSRFDKEGKEWIMEGVGVEPDVYVDNDPAAEFAGTDEQLNKAIEIVKEELKNFKPLPQTAPKYPDKSK